MLTRAAILDAIRAGHATAPKIARRLGSKPRTVSNILFKMKYIGRVVRRDPVEPDGVRNGRPPVQWAVNEEWTAKRYARS